MVFEKRREKTEISGSLRKQSELEILNNNLILSCIYQVQYRERDFLVRELYVTTISCVCGAVLFGLLGAGLALHNTAGNPKEAICHYPGNLQC